MPEVNVKVGDKVYIEGTITGFDYDDPHTGLIAHVKLPTMNNFEGSIVAGNLMTAKGETVKIVEVEDESEAAEAPKPADTASPMAVAAEHSEAVALAEAPVADVGI